MWAELSDVENAYESGSIADDRKEWVLGLIARAERLLLAKVPSIPRRIESGALDMLNVVDAVVTAVLRVVRNPEGMQSETEGNYLYSVQRDVAGGKLFFTGDDLALLRGSSGVLPGKPIRSPVPCWRSRP